MKKISKILAVCTALSLSMGILSGCGGQNGEGADMPQFSEIKEDEQIAVLHVKDFGDISLRFFEEYAPKAVENFVTHVEEGYYDGISFHRVIQDFVIQGGDPEGTGMGGESIWDTDFEMELTDKLWHFRGALAMARTQMPVSQGSQFYIVQAGVNPYYEIDSYWDQLESYVTQQIQQEEMMFPDQTKRDFYDSKDGFQFPDEVRQKYIEVGGVPSLDGLYTVFGMVVDGMDVVDAIAAVSVDENGLPAEQVTIESAEMMTYEYLASTESVSSEGTDGSSADTEDSSVDAE